MSATRTTRRSVALLAAVPASVLLLAGCGSGQVGTIGSQVAAVNGAQGQVGPLSLRDVTMAPSSSGEAYAAGDDVPLQFTITNSSVNPDTLTGITTSAGPVDLEGDDTVPGQSTLVSGTDTTSGTGEGLRADIAATGPISPGLNVTVTFTFRSAGSVSVPVPVAYDNSERETSEG